MTAIKDTQQPVSVWNNGVSEAGNRTDRAENKNAKNKIKENSSEIKYDLKIERHFKGKTT